MKKEMTKYINLQSTQDYMEVLNTQNPAWLELYKIKRWKYWWTWLNQHLLVDFMMWLSPEFKHKAITFIIEWATLAGKRHTIKEWYKKMANAIAESGNSNFREEATMLNVLVTWSPAKNQRARFDEDRMQLTDDLQTINAGLIRANMPLEQRKDILIKTVLDFHKQR
jgi:hypothetical protein